jgi:hypothetical protein
MEGPTGGEGGGKLAHGHGHGRRQDRLRVGTLKGNPGKPLGAAFDRLRARTSQLRQVLAANQIDRYVTSQAHALVLLARNVLYAVNRDVDFRPYGTTFKLADISVGRGHWSTQ